MGDRWVLIRIWVWRLAKLIAALAIVGGLAYWLLWSPVTVIEHRVKRADLVAEVMGTGTLEARVMATISPKISGRISEVQVDQGDRVTTGQLLVRLDGKELTQQVEIARANLDASEAASERIKTDKQRTMAILTQAEQHYERTAGLRKSNSVAESDLDQASEALSVAQAGLANAEAMIAEAQKDLVSAEKTLEYHQTRLADTKVSAPFDGLIVARQRDPGDVVVPGSSILTLISMDQLWISAWVDETEMAKLAEDQKARVVFRSNPDKSYQGKVTRLGRETDRETREFIVDVSVLDLPVNWAIGQRADVFIEAAREDSAVVIPPATVVWRDDRETIGTVAKTSGVFVSDAARARWVPVTLGLRSRTAVQVVDGLSEGDHVILPADQKVMLKHGQRVMVP